MLIKKEFLYTLLMGSFGGFVFYVLHFPLPWLLGALFAVLLANNFSFFNLQNPKFLASPVRAILGLAIGSAFSPEILENIPQYAVSLALMVPYLIISIYAGLLYFNRIAGLDKHTAFFCALPGGLIEMTLICHSYGADMRRVSMIQTSRVLLIVYTVPFALQYWTHTDLSGRTTQPVSLVDFPLDQGFILLLAAYAGWALVKKLGLPGAAIVGPMIVSAVVYSIGWADVRLPDILILIAQVVLGASIGCAFKSIQVKEVIHSVGVTVGFYIILAVTTAGTAWLVHTVTGVPLVATVLAFIPGSQAEMNLIALLVGVAVPYIALHHILRMIIVMTIAPVLSEKLLGASNKNA